MEGRIAITLGVFQEAYYKSNESRSSSLKWSSDLISHLIIMIRTQWLHRNSVVHKRRKDGLKIEEGKKISTQIYEALETGARDLDTVDHYLLDYSIEQIDEWTGAKKKIWLRSMTAAKNLKRTHVDEETEDRNTQRKRQKISHKHVPLLSPTSQRKKNKTDINRTGHRKSIRKKFHT